MKTSSRRSALSALGVLALLVQLGIVEASAQETTYVELGHPAYADLEALSAVGIVDAGAVLNRPYTRLDFARAIASASDSALTPAQGQPRFEEALGRLEVAFREELYLLRSGVAVEADHPDVHLRGAVADVAAAHSPLRPMRGGIAGNSLEADLAPLLFRDFDRVLADGETGTFTTALDIAVGPRLSVRITPRAGLMQVDNSTEGVLSLVDAYGRAAFGGIALEVGRNHLARGVLLSPHGPALDMVRLTNAAPWKLPLVGGVTASALIADMGANRDYPHSKLTVLDLGIRPNRHVELGLQFLNHQGGEGGPEASFWHRIKDVFLIQPQTGKISDKAIGGEALFMAPGHGFYAWVLGSTTDIDEGLRRPVGALWNDAVWAVGVKKTGLGREGRLDARVELRHAGVRPHTHAQYTDGLTIDRRVIGDDLGPMASSVEVGLDWNGPRDLLRLSASAETYRGDDWAFDGDDYLVADNPDELRRVAVAEWTRRTPSNSIWTSVRLGYESVTRFAFTEERRSNYLARISLRWLPN